ncbi:MAG: hypothetical protein Q7S48_02635 [bacterium]|nr:hypothetical protein [bacterium]
MLREQGGGPPQEEITSSIEDKRQKGEFFKDGDIVKVPRKFDTPQERIEDGWRVLRRMGTLEGRDIVVLKEEDGKAITKSVPLEKLLELNPREAKE